MNWHYWFVHICALCTLHLALCSKWFCVIVFCYNGWPAKMGFMPFRQPSTACFDTVSFHSCIVVSWIINLLSLLLHIAVETVKLSFLSYVYNYWLQLSSFVVYLSLCLSFCSLANVFKANSLRAEWLGPCQTPRGVADWLKVLATRGRRRWWRRRC